MAEAPDGLTPQLAAALGDRYAIERELGSGGMAIVFLARDLRHGRRVAIKVLRPDLGAAIGTARFLREIEVAASLSHPNILPLYDSGQAGNLVYYAMPFVDGESLADRLRRETQLPIEDALHITREVADALAYAHARGIVHRDIKPANILLTAQHALVADFGIARAIGAADTHQLTSAGMAIGTPAYMSPEQSAGATTIDGRSDIYSLGCVLYEMLIGEPPFGGPTPHVVLARHSSADVPSLHAVRPTIPEAVEAAVQKALAKMPADRFSTAAQLAQALEATSASPTRAAVPVSGASVRRLRVALVLGLVTLAAATAAGRVLWRKGVTDARVSADVVAVMPFRATGSGAGPGEAARALLDLLARRFTGDGGPRAVYPGTVAAALARVRAVNPGDLTLEEALRVGREVGAGLLLLGQVLETNGRLAVSASLASVPGGAALARVEEVTGSGDSLSVLADRIAAELLARASGESGDRLRALLEIKLSALRPYLSARAALEGGEFGTAALRFSAALDEDSTFAIAALGLISTGAFLSESLRTRGYPLAWAARDRLDAPDRLLLRAALGPNYAGPQHPRGAPQADQIRAWEDAVAALSQRAEAWYGLGDQLFRSGPWVGMADASQRAAAALHRAVELNPAHVPALGRLLDLSAAESDTGEVRALAAHYFALDSAGDLADYYRWRVAVALADQSSLAALRRRFPEFSPETLDRIIAIAQLDGIGLDDARRAVEVLQKLTTVSTGAYRRRRELALNRGRPNEAAALEHAQRSGAPLQPPERLRSVIEALFWGTDTAEASRIVAAHSAKVDARPPRRDTDAADPAFNDVCAVGLWRLAHGETQGVERLAALLRRPRFPAGPATNYQLGYVELCPAILEAQLATALHRPDAAARVQALDSIIRTAPPATTWIITAANLTVARLQEAHGNLGAALAATRRRAYATGPEETRVLVALSAHLREEGRLAALTGDRAGAIRAYRHYLALRTDPEPSVRPEVEQVRNALARLQVGAGGR